MARHFLKVKVVVCVVEDVSEVVIVGCLVGSSAVVKAYSSCLDPSASSSDEKEMVITTDEC